MIKRILITFSTLLLGSGLLLAQRGDTIYRNLGTFTTGDTGSIGPVPNIGQVYHQLIITFTNQSGQACLGTAVKFAGLYGSFDKSVYVNIAGGLTSPSQVYGRTFNYYGAFPYVKAQVTWADVPKCKATVAYVGSLYPPPQVVHGQYPDDPAGLYRFSVHGLPAGDTQIAVANNATIPVIDGLLINNNTAGQNLTFTCVDPDAGAHTFTAYEIYNIPAGASISLGTMAGVTSFLPIVDCSSTGFYGVGFSNLGMSLKVTASANTPTDIIVFYHYK